MVRDVYHKKNVRIADHWHGVNRLVMSYVKKYMEELDIEMIKEDVSNDAYQKLRHETNKI